MAIIRKHLSSGNFTKMDNNVARNREITDYSYRLYGFVAGFRDGFQLNDAYIAKSLGWSEEKVRRAKLHLKKADLICVEKIDRSTYFMYVGTSIVSATTVQANWKDNEKFNDKNFVFKEPERKHKELPDSDVVEVSPGEDIFGPIGD